MSCTEPPEFCACCVSVASNASRPTRTAGELSPSVLCLFYAISCRSDLTAVKYVRVSLEPMRQKQKPAPELMGLCRGARDYSSACCRTGSNSELSRPRSEENTLLMFQRQSSRAFTTRSLHVLMQVRIQTSFLALEKNPAAVPDWYLSG